MSVKTTLIALSLFIGQQVQASIEQKIDEKTAIQVTFSRLSHNRISIENGSVRKIFGDQALFSVSIDETIGQAFVNVLQDVNETPASLTVVTNSGLVQDILVLTSAKSSEHLVLKEEAEELAQINSLTDLHSHTIEFLNTILSGKTPLGYGKRDLKTEDKLELPSPLEATAIRTFEGPFEKITVHKIANKGRKPIVIKAEAIKKADDHWVFLDVNELDFTEKGLCIVSSSKD